MMKLVEVTQDFSGPRATDLHSWTGDILGLDPLVRESRSHKPN